MKPSHLPATITRKAMRAYTDIGIETQVRSASPEQLITLLFDAARAAIARARIHMSQDDIEGRGMALSRAIDIVDSGLKASVDHDAGGDLACNLTAVYELVIRNLMLANLRNDLTSLELADRLLADIGEAWRISTSCGTPS